MSRTTTIDRPHTARRLSLQESESVLFERWRNQQDLSARDALAERFLPLAKKLARRYARGMEPAEDLVQVASLGLVKAIDRFDPEFGNHFASFAVPTILGELRRHFRDASWAVHVSRATQERALEVQQTMEMLLSETGRSPSVGEIAEYLELDHAQVLDALQVSQAHSAVSLDAPAGSGESESEGDSRMDTIGGEDQSYLLVDETSVVAQALAALEPRERQILGLRFFGEMTQSEIAARVGLSQMQVSRLLRRSLERMREVSEQPLA
jgi:RNA polymerase sigma-B factor